jgi:hypothetical protein
MDFQSLAGSEKSMGDLIDNVFHPDMSISISAE